MAYRYRLILMATQPTVLGEPVLPTSTVTGTWSKPAAIALTGTALDPTVSGTKPADLAFSGAVTFSRDVS